MHAKYHGPNATVIHGSSPGALDEVPDATVDLIFADPPYNIGKRFANFVDRWSSDGEYIKWCEEWLMACVRKLKDHGAFYVMSSTQCMPYIDLFLRDKVHVLSRIVWHYDSSGVQAKNKFGSMYEPILFCVKDQNRYTFNSEAISVEAKTGAKRLLIDYRKPTPAQYNTSKTPGNVWYFPRVRYRMAEYEEHPSQKPEALLERIIKVSSNVGDTVLDPFAGTFTTNAVAKRLGRQSIGVERELQYVKIGLRRLGIRSELHGEALRGPEKTYVRRNGKHAVRRAAEAQRDFFEDAGE
ncbi:MAG TPA: adenine-specific DNA-methyltransferase [Pirellulales bacterium]|nr:adenine-specific DNA-methyltransferase [Pirellulales bacterium]